MASFKPTHLKTKNWMQQTDYYKIDPNKYINEQIMNCINSINLGLQSERPSEGLLSYTLNVDTLESLALADKKLDENDEEYKTFIESIEKRLMDSPSGDAYRKNDILFQCKVARFRFSFLCKKIFSTRAIRMEGVF